MNVRSIVVVTLLLIAASPIPATVSTDTFRMRYQHTTMLLLEADLRLHLCHLKEFSLHLIVFPPDPLAGTDSLMDGRGLGNILPNEQAHAFDETLLCRKEAEEAIKARLPGAEQELSEQPVALEKLKSLVAAWLASMTVIPRTMLSKEALLSRQEEDQRTIRQKQSELEVELFWPLNQPRGWASRGSPRS